MQGYTLEQIARMIDMDDSSMDAELFDGFSLGGCELSGAGAPGLRWGDYTWGSKRKLRREEQPIAAPSVSAEERRILVEYRTRLMETTGMASVEGDNRTWCEIVKENS